MCITPPFASRDAQITTATEHEDFTWDTHQHGVAHGKGGLKGMRLHIVPDQHNLLRLPLRQPYTQLDINFDTTNKFHNFMHSVAHDHDVHHLIAHHNRLANDFHPDAYPFDLLPTPHKIQASIATTKPKSYQTRVYNFLQYHNHLVHHHLTRTWPTYDEGGEGEADQASSSDDDDSDHDDEPDHEQPVPEGGQPADTEMP